MSQGGKITAVYGFNTFNEFIGQSSSQSVAEGDSVTFTIDQSSPGEQATYVGVSNADDATCVSWITVEQRDNTPGGAWTGDIGSECGQRWHNGNQKAGKLKDSDEDYVPRCLLDSHLPMHMQSLTAYQALGSIPTLRMARTVQPSSSGLLPTARTSRTLYPTTTNVDPLFGAEMMDQSLVRYPYPVEDLPN